MLCTLYNCNTDLKHIHIYILYIWTGDNYSNSPALHGLEESFITSVLE